MGLPTPLLAALALAGGAAGGVGLERAGVLSPLSEPEAPTALRGDRVPVLDCPDGAPLAALGRGDRVLATGRSADGDWIEIRSPLGLDQRAWLAAGALVPGGDLDGLPVHDCERPTLTTTTTSSTTTSTSTTLAPETTTTALPDVTTTTRPPRPTTTLPPAPADAIPPGVTNFTATPAQVAEEPNICADDPPLTLGIDAVDNVGVVAVTYDWTTGQGGSSGSGALSFEGQNHWGGSFSPPLDAVPDSAPPRVMTITATATDAAGNATTSPPRQVTVHSSAGCMNVP